MFGLLEKRKLCIETLPDDFIVYKHQEDRPFFYVFTGGIRADKAVTSCCEVRPVKYFPDGKGTKRWWLICPSCHYAIKANGELY